MPASSRFVGYSTQSKLLQGCPSIFQRQEWGDRAFDRNGSSRLPDEIPSRDRTFFRRNGARADCGMEVLRSAWQLGVVGIQPLYPVPFPSMVLPRRLVAEEVCIDGARRPSADR